jgi:hypothetical protein
MAFCILLAAFCLQAQNHHYVAGKVYINPKGFMYINTGDTLNLAGNMTTVRHTSVAQRGTLSFAGSADWKSGNGSFVKGYVRSHKTGAFTFPIGEGNYRPAHISAAASAAPTDAAYYQPMPPPYSISALDAGVAAVTNESWVIQGTTATIITLSWSADISSFASDFTQLGMAGWDGSKWVKIESAVETISSIFGSASSLTGKGSVSTVSAITPNQYAAYTLANTSSLVNAATPVITTHPASANIPEGAPGAKRTLSVVATSPDGGTLTYQWYSNTTASNTTGTAILGATGASYPAPIDVVGTFYYYVVVTNTIPDNGDGGIKAATRTSNVATLIIYEVISDFIIRATAEPNGTITPAGFIIVPRGGSQTFTFAPDAGYRIYLVLIDGIPNQTAIVNGYYTFNNVIANRTIHVSFTLITPPVYTITATAGANGTISPSGVVSVNGGNSQTFNFTPAPGYRIGTVLVDGTNNAQAVANKTHTFYNVDSDHTIHATFEPTATTYKITSTAGAGGTIDPLGVVTVIKGGSQTFTFTPSSGYKISLVLVNGVHNQAALVAGKHTFSNVSANHTIAVTFAVKPSVDPTSVEENGLQEINIFSFENRVTLLNKNLIPLQQVDIMDMLGSVVYSGTPADERTDITLNVATGIYVVRLLSKDQQLIMRKVSIRY